MTTRLLLFDPAFEQVPEDEADTIAELAEAMPSITEKTYADSGHALRIVHAKSHGLLVGELQVVAGLPRELAQGIFARPATLPVVLRLCPPIPAMYSTRKCPRRAVWR